MENSLGRAKDRGQTQCLGVKGRNIKHEQETGVSHSVGEIFMGLLINQAEIPSRKILKTREILGPCHKSFTKIYQKCFKSVNIPSI